MQPGTERRQAAGGAGLLRDRAGLAAVEDGDRAGLEGGDVDVAPVGRERQALGRDQGAAERAAGGAQVDQAAGGPFLLASGHRSKRVRVKEVTLLANSEVT